MKSRYPYSIKGEKNNLLARATSLDRGIHLARMLNVDETVRVFKGRELVHTEAAEPAKLRSDDSFLGKRKSDVIVPVDERENVGDCRRSDRVGPTRRRWNEERRYFEVLSQTEAGE